MNIAIYGGSFNPPHLGHIEAAYTVAKQLHPDKLLIIPCSLTSHKEEGSEQISPEDRLELCRRAFRTIEGSEVSDIELERGGRSYTAETVERLLSLYPESEITLALGADLLSGIESWYRAGYIFESCTLAVLSREEGRDEETERLCEHLRRDCGARVRVIEHVPVSMSSHEIRRRLRFRQGADMLDSEVYAEIVRRRLYDAQPELCWLREQTMELIKPERIAHVTGCESEAVMLARHWGEDPELAAEAGILHDITKKQKFDEQLILCRKYGIIPDETELSSPQLLHALTGAAYARDRFGVPAEVCEAIRWHTTGKPDMTLLEKIIYLADMTEPTRSFDGVDRLRKLCLEDIDSAMSFALGMSLEHIRQRNIEPHMSSVEAYIWYNSKEE